MDRIPASDRGAGALVHHVVAAQAARTPDAVAVVADERTLSYRQLERRANRLAQHLIARGVGRESLVGLAVDRSPEMVVAVLGVLKAGAAYVPLDPGLPKERLGFMWRDAQRGHGGARPVLLSRGHLLSSLPDALLAGDSAALVDLDADRAAIAAAPDSDPAVPLDAANLAYVIYTSGSTGTPKGVQIAHRGVVNVIEHAVSMLRVTPASRVLQLATLSFDASVLEMFTALFAGARLVLTPAETLMSGEALATTLRRQGITTLAIPPSLLDKVPEDARFPELTDIVVGGEACSAATAERWAAGRRLSNAYAPTESTIYTTTMGCRPPFDQPPAMGRAIPGTAVHLLDRALRPVAGGEQGEIFLAGLGLTRGYRHRPGLTAERLVPDPTGAAGGRLYRSGDLARRDAAGDLAFAGRADHQVKIRGLRIELGEIEAVLGQHPAVRSAVVEVRPSEGGEARLVAYLVTRAGATPTVGEWRAFLEARLPASMVPAAFVRLDALPMTATGKVDRKALPDPGSERPALSTAYRAPESDFERTLAAVWGELLGVDQVGVDDDLFELGGHSLIAAQIVSRARAAFGRELPILEVFEHPTVAALAARLEGAAEAAPGPPPIAPAPRDPSQPLPVTFAQERVWFLIQLAPDSVAYNFNFTLRFRGSFDLEAWRRALQTMVERHEVLRTTFPARDGRPVQVVHPPWTVALPVTDLGALPAAEREAAALTKVRAAMAHAFDVTALPLLRLELLRLADDDHLFIQVEHHFVHDGWSLAVYLRELEALYRAYAAGRPSPLPPPPIQYADFAWWQRRWLRGQVLADELDYWRRRLAGSPPLLELPADRPRGRQHTFRGGSLRVDLPDPLYAAIRAFSRRQGATLFMTMLAAFETLMYRYTGQTDLVLGSGLANRRLRESEEMVGMVVNTVVLRLQLDGGMTFGELLSAVRRMTLETHEHQDMPFEKLVEALQPDRDLSRNPLFQVLFSFHDAPVPDFDLPGLGAELYEHHNGSAKSDLNVVVKPLAEQRVGRKHNAGHGAETLTMVWEYASDLFDRATVERMWGHYQTLLAALVEDPGQTLDDLPLLTADELRALDTLAPPARPAPFEAVHLQVAAIAARQPAATAVAAGDRRLDYRQLVARAGAHAARLRALGIGPESVVAVLTDRAPELPLAVLSVLAAGAAYLPLDPAHPPQRLAFMLADAGVQAVLARPDLADLVPASGPPVVAIEATAEESADQAAGGFAPAAVDPEQLAYVVYTSGSTGTPKGVQISHRGLANLVAWHRRVYRLGADDRATLIAGPAFDASVWEVWPYLAAGAALHVPDADTRRTPAQLAAWLDAEGISLTFLPTPLAEAVLAELEAAPRPALRLRALLTGGDRLRRRPPGALGFTLINHYGPSESSVVATAGPVTPQRADAGGGPQPPPSIGRAIDGIEVHLLDRRLRPVPVGVPAELMVGGVGLARGYRGQRALSAERFVPDPRPAAAAGSRLYRSGDLARYRADGSILFLGRVDQQVQIRGFRVEPGEVETLLAAQPGIHAAVVVPRETADGVAGLVAYCVAEGELDAQALRAALAERLPDYMVPAAFVALEAIPLTANGKVDRAALPAVDLVAAAEAEAVAPRTPSEELVAGVWAGVLEAPSVGVDDSFFALGGHSLLATQVLARVHDATGVAVPLSDFFEDPTVAALARAVDAALGGEAASPAPAALPPRPPGAPLPLAFAQERLWFLEQLTPGTAAYNIARGYQLEGPLAVPALAAAVADLAQRHETLRTRFRGESGESGEGGGVEQVVMPPSPPPLPVIDLSALPAAAGEREGARRAAEEAARPFALARGPLIRVALLRHAAERHVLLLSLHHIVADGWSMSVLARELRAFYAARRAGQAPSPAPLGAHYADFARWQRAQLRGESLARLLGYWRDHLAGIPEAIDLPFDRPRPAEQSFRGEQVSLDLDAALRGQLEAAARDRGATPFMVLLAAFATLLHRTSGQADVVVGTPVAGREQTWLEGLIGFFVNTLALRLGFDDDPGFDAVVARARAAVLGGHAHQMLPFEKLVGELAPQRDLSHAPLFQVLFSYLTTPDATLALDGLTVSDRPLERAESRFDLELHVQPLGAGDGGGGGGLRAVLRYDSALFDRATAVAMVARLGTVLAAALAAPSRPVSALPLLDSAARAQALAAGNEAPRTLPTLLPLHALVAAQAARTPDAVAVIAGDERMTYARLLGQAGRLAGRLRARGLGAETPVGVLLGRSASLVASLLGVLEAGGAYVPLDPAYPAGRLRLILDDTRAPLVLVEAATAALVPEGAAAERLHVDRDDPDPPRDRPPAAVELDHLAYLIYTSGSTGRPKGVAISHRNAATLVRWGHGAFPPAQRAGVLASTSICFDLSIFELFVPLAGGGTVILADDLLAFPELPAAAEVTLVNSVPSAVAELLRVGDLPPAVTTVNLAGEPLRQPLVQALLEQPGVVRVHDLYGPSEDTTYSTWARRRGDGPEIIGRPIANSRAYVLDARLEPLPAGLPGELYLAGDGLARGYYRRPGSSAGRFVPDPFAPPGRGGERLYKSGDRARRRPDGDLAFLGRLDHQVKVRGYRVELGEIEVALGAEPSVAEAAVDVRELAPGDRQLVAYAVAAAGQATTEEAADALRRSLGGRLPAYMVPARLVFLEALPRTASGKLDRRALPAPAARAGGASAPPRSDTEKGLAAIWQEVLGVETVGVEDSFFDLGGHSLTATRVVARVRRAFEVELPLRALFQTPTLGALAAAIAARRSTDRGRDTRPIARITRVARTARPRPDTGDADHALAGASTAGEES